MELNRLLDIGDLVYPVFIKEGLGKPYEEIAFMPGINRLSLDGLMDEAALADSLGIGSLLLFGIPAEKSTDGESAYRDGNVISIAAGRIKKYFPRMSVMADICLCAYTTHGHCGILDRPGGSIMNGHTLEALSKTALAYAAAGVDYAAPSAMACGQVAAIRKTLDGQGYHATKIMAYSAKFKSNYYGPFRDAADSAPKFGDRSAYQIAHMDARRAKSEIRDDIDEGADIVMVKPALAYLDIIKEAKNISSKPVAAYNVSGEYAFVKDGARRGYWDEKGMVLENMASIKRAGADIVITYHAKEVARWLRDG